MARKRLGDVLVEQRLITPTQLDEAIQYGQRWGQKLGQSLVAMGSLTEARLIEALGKLAGVPVVDLSKTHVELGALQAVPKEMANEHEIFPFGIVASSGRQTLRLAVADPFDLTVIEQLEFRSGQRIRIEVASPAAIQACIRRYYDGERVAVPALGAAAIRAGAADDRLDMSERGGAVMRPASAPPPSAVPGIDPRQLQQLDAFFQAPPGAQPSRIETLELRFQLLVDTLRRSGAITKQDADRLLGLLDLDL